MYGIILAAGRGSRLEALTQNKPKCLVEIHERPLLEWQIDALKNGGVDNISIIGGYRADCLEPYGFPVIVNDRWDQSNMVVSLLSASIVLERTGAIISYADIFYPASIVRTLIETPGQIVVAQDPRWQDLWMRRFQNPLDDAETFIANESGRVTEIGDKPDTLDAVQGQFMGIFKITAAGWAVIKEHLSGLCSQDVDKLDMTGLLRALIQKGETICSVSCEGIWGEVDTPFDQELYERIFSYGDMREIL
ncbi:MAG: phosphocholine cytidylyltransferase family protein [Alphaproteobacteria bacterium]